MFIIILLFYSINPGNLSIDFENGFAHNTSNKIRIPGDGGTYVSLSDGFNNDSSYFYRIRLSYLFGKRHNFSFLFAPLDFNSNGIKNTDINFNDTNFSAGDEVLINYRFDSYRLTYRYDFFISEKYIIGAGFSAKIRDAAIKFKNSSTSSVKSNTGFVPLVNFLFLYNFYNNLSFIFDFDALAAPQGRAEDIQIAIISKINQNLDLRFGYRVLEGGADNEEVYSFAFIQYILFGLKYNFVF